MTTIPNPGPTRTPRGVEIDSRIGEAATRASAASKEDSHPQAILKFHCPSSLDYRAHQGLGNIYRTLYTNLFHDALPGGGVIFSTLNN